LLGTWTVSSNENPGGVVQEAVIGLVVGVVVGVTDTVAVALDVGETVGVPVAVRGNSRRGAWRYRD
jgi:hypothetical protein